MRQRPEAGALQLLGRVLHDDQRLRWRVTGLLDAAPTAFSSSRKGERYYRHIEFQSKTDPEMARRFFRYNSQLTLQYDAPVLTTVLYLRPRRSKREAAFRVMLGGREINRWTFEEISLHERDAREGLSGAPALAALVPLMKGGSERRVVEQAARRIERAFPGRRLSEAEDVL